VDEHTVKFTSVSRLPFLYTLANDGASIINPAVLKANAADDARVIWRKTPQAPGRLC
jgi:peptide/nickel transport system substrate-binding protein